MVSCRAVAAGAALLATACGGSTASDVIGSVDSGVDAAAGGDGGTTTVPNLGPDGGVNPPGAGPGGDTTRVACGATSCAVATETCCVLQNRDAVPPTTSYACATGACAVPPGGGDVTALKCSGAANCPTGTVCCVQQVNGGTSSACQASCSQDQAQLCDPAAGDAGGCPSSQPCSSSNIGDWGLPRTYATCGGRGN